MTYKRTNEELIVAAKELKKKDEEIARLQQMAHRSVYQRIYDHGWNRACDFYVRDAIKDREEAFHEVWLSCLK